MVSVLNALIYHRFLHQKGRGNQREFQSLASTIVGGTLIYSQADRFGGMYGYDEVSNKTCKRKATSKIEASQRCRRV